MFDPRVDPRERLMRDLDLPRGEERELVTDRARVYELNRDDSRTLAAVGAFRVVPEHDLDIDHETLEHLHDEGLAETVDLGDDERGLTLTRDGRDLLDSHARLPPASAGAVLPGRDRVRRKAIQSNRRNRNAFQILGAWRTGR